jgi:GT2 family glycosyltransferase
MLSECLSSAFAAANCLSQPFEIIVVVDGGNPDDYRNLAGQFQSACWIFNNSSLGYSGAIRRGLEAAHYDWVYLLNSDMILDERALAEVFRWSAPHVFAVGSQIFFKDTARRREETGWAKFKILDGCIEIYDDPPEDEVTVRGAAYAGGGSSLFQRRLLRKILGGYDPYYPFYWEDFEWSTIAWKMGYEIIFCPASKAWHYHRATISRFYPPEEIQRVFKRNAIQFQLRNLRHLGSFEQLSARIMNLDPVSFWDIVGRKNVWRVFRTRLSSAYCAFDDECLRYVCDKYLLKPRAELTRPSVLVVSPFAIYPPSHGGAMRLCHLLQHLSADFDLIVLSDEQEA